MSAGNFDFWRDEVDGSKDALVFFSGLQLRLKRSDQTDCGFSIGTWMSYDTQEMSEIRVSKKQAIGPLLQRHS